MLEKLLYLMNTYNLREIRTSIDDTMGYIKVTFYSKDNKCISKLLLIDEVFEPSNTIYFDILLRDMGKALSND